MCFSKAIIIFLSVFLSSSCSSNAQERALNVVEMGRIRLIAIPESHEITSRSKLKLKAYIVNDTGKDVVVRVKGSRVNGELNFSRFIGGESYDNQSGSFVLIGSTSDHRGGFETSISLTVLKNSSFEIGQDFNFSPFPHDAGNKNIVGVFYLKLYIEGLEVKSNDFIVKLRSN